MTRTPILTHPPAVAKPTQRCLWLALPILALIGMTAACNVKKAYPARQTFLLETHRDANQAADHPATAILRVRPATVVVPFDDKAFVYRGGDLAYETDFYHQFLVPPRALITDAVHQWLAASGLFHAVLHPSSRVNPTHTLETSLTALYGDYRNPSAPLAVLVIHFHLLGESLAGPKILFHRAYRESVPVERTGAESLAQSWSHALERVLAAFETDLANLLADSLHTPDLDGQGTAP